MVIWVLRLSDGSFTWDKMFNVAVRGRISGFISNEEFCDEEL